MSSAQWHGLCMVVLFLAYGSCCETYEECAPQVDVLYICIYLYLNRYTHLGTSVFRVLVKSGTMMPFHDAVVGRPWKWSGGCLFNEPLCLSCVVEGGSAALRVLRLHVHGHDHYVLGGL